MSHESRKFQVPDQLANLYDFANSLDLRRFMHRGVQHVPGDDLRSPRQLEAWMSARGLSASGGQMTATMLETALQLRSGLRAYLELQPGERRSNRDVRRALNQATARFALRVEVGEDGGLNLRPGREDALAGLSTIVAEFYDSAASGALDRLKTCASEECRRIFFDRSKPGSRRWCLSTLCGNRIKTRTYRERHRET
jgi:predicted RNA-binding Zn ribbon-like protein